jgi:hypothetical protein
MAPKSLPSTIRPRAASRAPTSRGGCPPSYPSWPVRKSHKQVDRPHRPARCRGLRVFGPHSSSGLSLSGFRGASGQSMRSTCNRPLRHPWILLVRRPDKQPAFSTLQITLGRFLRHPEAIAFTRIARSRKPRHAKAPSGVIDFST